MRAYHRVDPLMDERKGDYSPAQFGAFLKVQLVAGRQKVPGRFRSMAALRGILPESYTRHVAFLVAEGDLVVAEDGSVYVDGWDEWQEGDLTVAERMARLRNRRRNDGRNATVSATVTPAVTEPSPPANANANANARLSGEGFGEGFDGRADLEAFLAVRFRGPTKKQRELMDAYVRVFDVTGPERAARLIFANPDDPIGALIRDRDEFIAQRRDEARKAEAPKPAPVRRPARGLTGINAELAALLRAKDAERGDAA